MRIAPVVSLAMVVLFSGVSQAEDTPLWKKVGTWDIRVDTTLGRGCFMFNSYVDGSVLRVGFDRDRGENYALIGNDNWKSIEAGKDYDIQLQFGEAEAWDVPARGVMLDPEDNLNFLWFWFADREFVDELMRKHYLTVRYRGREIASLQLKGSYAAAMEMVNCQRTMDDTGNARAPSPDPFRGDRQAPVDPFTY